MKNTHTEPLEQASIRQYCKTVRMPAIAANFATLAEEAVRENHSHVRYLEAFVGAGVRGTGPARDCEPVA